MFNIKSWVSNAIIAAYRNGQYSDIDVAIVVGNWMSRGLLTEADAETIMAATSAPQIRIQPQGVGVQAGGTVSLSVTATGAEPLMYQWSKDGVVITGATSATYTIAAVQTSDTGGYTCTVSNSTANVTSNTATIALVDAPAAQ